MAQVISHLTAASRVVELRIATRESKRHDVDNDVDDDNEFDNGFVHDLDDFLHSCMVMDRHNIWFVCWRFLLLFTRCHYDVPGRKLTFGALWRTFGSCTNASFPPFVSPTEDSMPVSYDNAFLILKRARDISLHISTSDAKTKSRGDKRVPDHLTKLRLELHTPPANHVMFFAEWLFLLRSWFHVFIEPLSKDWACDALNNEINHLTTPMDDNQNVEDLKPSQKKQDVSTMQVATPTMQVATPTIHDLDLDTVFRIQVAAFFSQKKTALCFFYRSETCTIYSKIGRLNKVQMREPDIADRIRSLIKDLSKSSLLTLHRDIEPTHQFCLSITIDRLTQHLLSYTIVTPQEVDPDIYQRLLC